MKHRLLIVGALVAQLAACSGAEDTSSAVDPSEAAPGAVDISGVDGAQAADAIEVASDDAGDSEQAAIDAKIEELLAAQPDAVRLDERTVSMADGQVVLELVPIEEGAEPGTPDTLLDDAADSELGTTSQPLKISIGFNVYIRLTPNDRREAVAIMGIVGGGAAGAAICAAGSPILQAVCVALGSAVGERVARAAFDRRAERPECGLEVRAGFSSGVRFIRGDSSSAC